MFFKPIFLIQLLTITAAHELKVGTLNVLAIPKATKTPGGFPNFDDKALKLRRTYQKDKNDFKVIESDMLNDFTDEEKDYAGWNYWMTSVLDLLVTETKINLLALQEVDPILFETIKEWVNRNEKTIYFNVNGGKENPKKPIEIKKGADSLILLWTHPTKQIRVPNSFPAKKLTVDDGEWSIACPEQEGTWQEGKALKCDIVQGKGKTQQTIKGLFVHGDSNWKLVDDKRPKTFPEGGPYDLVMGDWNIDNRNHVEALIGEGMSLGTTGTFEFWGSGELNSQSEWAVGTLLRAEYKFRKVTQQLENTCGFKDFGCTDRILCTKGHVQKMCSDKVNKNKGCQNKTKKSLEPCQQTDAEKTNEKRDLAQCKSATKLFNDFVDKKIWIDLVDFEISKTENHSLTKWKNNPQFNFAKWGDQWGFELDDNCKITDETRDAKIQPADLDWKAEHEDWIAIASHLVNTEERKVLKFKDVFTETNWPQKIPLNGGVAKPNEDYHKAPHVLWASDHFPMYTTITLKTKERRVSVRSIIKNIFKRIKHNYRN